MSTALRFAFVGASPIASARIAEPDIPCGRTLPKREAISPPPPGCSFASKGLGWDASRLPSPHSRAKLIPSDDQTVAFVAIARIRWRR